MRTRAEDVARNLRTVILLAGRVGRNPLVDGAGRSVLGLPLDCEQTVLDVWVRQLIDLTEALDLPHLEVRIAVDRSSDLRRLAQPADHARVVFSILRDPAEYRGTAGLVKDLTSDLAGDDRILVAAANQIQREPLRDVLRGLSRGPESVAIVPHGAGELAGAFLLRCERLHDVPDVGFVDLKEQAIPAAQGRDPLTVTRRPRGASLPIRTRAEYLAALRTIHAPRNAAQVAVGGPFAEAWNSTFTVVEPGADVAPNAVLQDSVVLAGGRVEAGAVVARSVVCSGGVVRRGKQAVEAMVTA